MAARKKKDMLDLMKEVRTTWNMNPSTRVQEDERKDKKKRRQEERKEIKEVHSEDPKR